jgi:phage host-nuclease inhibitor protein Gam
MSAKAIRRKVGVVPNNLDEAVKAVVRIRELESQIEAIEAKSNAEIRKLEEQIAKKRQKADEDVKDLREESGRLSEAVFIFAQGHKMELTDNLSKKTVELSSGDKLRWYLTAPSVKVEDEKQAIWELKRKDLQKFIRTKEEINKESILAEPDEVKDLEYVSVSQDEIFSIVLSMQKVELRESKKFRSEA